jgi:hypothetical protein
MCAFVFFHLSGELVKQHRCWTKYTTNLVTLLYHFKLETWNVDSSENSAISQSFHHLQNKAIEEHMTDRYELFTGQRSARNLYLYQKLGYREFKRISVKDSIILVFFERYRTSNQPMQQIFVVALVYHLCKSLSMAYIITYISLCSDQLLT